MHLVKVWNKKFLKVWAALLRWNIYTDSNLYVPGLIITPKFTGVKRKKTSRSVTFISKNKFGKDYENSLKQIVVLSIGFTVFIEFLESCI